MNKTLTSIILAGVMALGYNESKGQLWMGPEDKYLLEYTTKEFPKDTLVGYVALKKNTGKDILRKIKNGCKIEVVTKEQGEYSVTIQKDELYRFQNIHQDSLITIYTMRVVGYVHHDKQFVDGIDLGMYARPEPRKWSEKEYSELKEGIELYRAKYGKKN